MMQRIKLVLIGTLLGLAFNANADEAGVGQQDPDTSTTQVTSSDSTTESTWYGLLLTWFGSEGEGGSE